MTEPYHAGERAVQEQVGERDAALINGRVIAARIPDGARAFISQQQACVMACTAPGGEIWASFLVGPKGFVSTSTSLDVIDIHITDATGVLRRVPPFDNVKPDDQVGLLFIEFTTRRRLRVNGAIDQLAAGHLRISVDQAYPNCPKYIQRREPVEAPPPEHDDSIVTGEFLTESAVRWIERSDTFFVASGHPEGPMDASHRGGPVGFVKFINSMLRIPDYPGNSMFNTFGNLSLNPRAGLVLVDFEHSRQLQLTGNAYLDLEAGEVNGRTGGTGRWWDFHPERWIISPLNAPLAWRFVGASPFNP